MNTKNTNYVQDGYDLPTNKTWMIFLISVLGLFLEMLFIRWIGTEVRIFAYLQNTILVACFLGLGLGSFTCRKPIYLRQTVFPILILLLLMAIPFSRQGLHSISYLLSGLDDFLIWSNMTASNPWMTVISVFLGVILTFVLCVLVVDTFVPIGRFLGRLLDDHPNTIWAYSANILGSLIGTWLFVLLSYLYQPPLVWFLIVFAIILLFVILMRQDWKLNLLFLTSAAVLSFFATLEPDSIETLWSPYQKLVMRQSYEDEIGEYNVTVNNASFQELIDLSPEYITQNPEIYPPEMLGYSQYDIPMLLHPNPQSVLIVGAGTGNDAAGGLRNGAEEITAVEIDPGIIEIGKNYHPESPYSSPHVEIINDDARSFFATTKEKYDIIIFGLLDSHTTTAMTNARLDHYVYTIESITQAKSLLEDGGIIVLTFYVMKPYIADRIENLLNRVFDEKPIVFQIPYNSYGRGGVMFIAGDLEKVAKQLESNQPLNAYIEQLKSSFSISMPGTTKITTDDWPYIYLELPRIPLLFYLIIVMMTLIFWYSYKKWGGGSGLVSRWDRTNFHFFFLGAAFLLLEVQNISKASVVLGNTWEVNAIIISGILFMALLANWLAYRFPKIPVKFAYFALISICLGLYFVDLAQFAFLPYFYKAIIVGSLTSLPMLFSGFVFISSFQIADEKNNALGANLLGSLVGALSQSITFVTGIKALLLIVAGFYLLSLLTLPNRMKRKIKSTYAVSEL